MEKQKLQVNNLPKKWKRSLVALLASETDEIVGCVSLNRVGYCV